MSQPASPARSTWIATPQQVERVIAPVLPHSGSDKHIPVICSINLEIEGSRFLAVASDRYTLGVCWSDLTDWDDEVRDRELHLRDMLQRAYEARTGNIELPADWEAVLAELPDRNGVLGGER